MTDKTVYVSIGNSDGKLTQILWADFHSVVDKVVRSRATEVFGAWVSESTAKWQNACWGFSLDEFQIDRLKDELSTLAANFKQESIAWAEVPEAEMIKAAE